MYWVAKDAEQGRWTGCSIPRLLSVDSSGKPDCPGCAIFATPAGPETKSKEKILSAC
jgi:hypothetical protein